MQIKDVMTDEVTSINTNSNISEVANIMKNLNVGSVPVVEQNKPVGIVTDRDIAIRNVAGAGDTNSSVRDIMSSNLIYGTPDMSTREAAKLMSEKQIRRLPIVDQGNLVGIVSLGDLAVQSKTDMEAGEALSSISIPSKPKK